MLRAKLKKLRKMGLHEVLVRVQAKVQQQRERRAYQHGRRPAFPTVNLAELLQRCQALIPGSNVSPSESPRDMVRHAEERAESILAGECSMLGWNYDLRGEVDWHADPRTPHRFPSAYWADVPLMQTSGGEVDVKYVWEVGRHQFLVDLAKGWWATRRPEFVDRQRALLLDWIAANPVGEGVHWASALEVAMRGISWIWVLALTADSDWDNDDLQTVAQSMAEHADFLSHHFSFYTSPYNHLIGEVASLYLLAGVLADLPQADRWRRASRSVLVNEGEKQFYGDGFTVEQATGYHFYTLGFFTLARLASEHANEPLHEIDDVIHRAFSAGAAFRQPDGVWPAIGDVDSARSIPVYHENFFSFDSVCHLGAVLYEDGHLKVGNEAGEETWWLLGADGHQKWEALERRTRPTQLLPDSGYAICKGADVWVAFDCGPIADGVFADSTPSTVHGHADTLQLLYWSADGPRFVDPGMERYFGPTEVVDGYRASAAHSTVALSTCPQAVHAGPLTWSHVTGVPRLSTSEGSLWQCSGELRWPDGTVIKRFLLWTEETGLCVADRIWSPVPTIANWTWHLAGSHLLDLPVDHGEKHASLGLEASPISIASSAVIDEIVVQPSNRAVGYGQLETSQRCCMKITVDQHALVVTAVSQNRIAWAASVDELSVQSKEWSSTDASCRHSFQEITWQVGPPCGATIAP